MYESDGSMQVHVELDRFFKGEEWEKAIKHIKNLTMILIIKMVLLKWDVDARNQLIKALLITLIKVEEQSTYITLNTGREIYIPDEIADKSMGVDCCIAMVLQKLV